MVTNNFLLYVNMLESKLNEEIKRQAAIVSLAKEYFDLETAALLKLSRLFVFNSLNTEV